MRLLLETLKLYPVLEGGHQPLSKSQKNAENEQLLEEALAESRSENKKALDALMSSKSRFQKIKGHDVYRFSIKISDADWLLQVLNDIRVGAWVQLGSPDKTNDSFAALDEETAPSYWAMEVAGHFQMTLLQALTEQGELGS
ncbi:hypothetical protein Cflav_PD3576 [Pedosphaera parvula Ellin514]|uniref:DUF2017 domain-containing protein n=2 Tax=Pedosphaera TaxID=1032526 RepID=B9XH83_PEDPL|nr:hypothetical protein Cflav_PD3576 [Pedosphaera parvula Ellin514]